MADDLPTEILESIFSYLVAKDLWSCLGVSRRWRSIANYDRLWKRHCLDIHIEEGAVSNLLDENPLCSWATAFYSYFCRPVANWKKGRWTQLHLPLKSQECYQFWHGQHGYIYYYLLGRVCIYTITDDNIIELTDQLNVEVLNQDNNHMYPTIIGNSVHLAVCNCNIALIFEKIEGHFRHSHCFALSQEDLFVSTDKHNFDLFVTSNFQREYLLKTKHFLGFHVWFYNAGARSFLVFDLVNNTVKFKLDYRNLVTRPKIPLLVSLHATKVEVYNSSCEIVLTIDETCISSICFNARTLVANKLSFKAGTTARNLQSWDMSTGKELAFMPSVRATDVQLHPISAHMIVLQIEGNQYSVACICARTANVFWKFTDPSDHSWFPELKIVMYEFVVIWPSYNDNDKYSLYDIRSGVLIEERKKIHADNHHVTDLLWVLDNRSDIIIIDSFL